MLLVRLGVRFTCTGWRLTEKLKSDVFPLSRAVLRPIKPIDSVTEIAQSDPREVGASGGQARRGVARVAVPKVAPSRASQVSLLLDSPEIRQLIADLEATRWTGRPGYPVRTMVGLALAGMPSRSSQVRQAFSRLLP